MLSLIKISKWSSKKETRTKLLDLVNVQNSTFLHRLSNFSCCFSDFFNRVRQQHQVDQSRQNCRCFQADWIQI